MKKSAFALLAVLAFVCTSNPTNAATLHVWQDSPSPGPPFSNWATAAHAIQEAVDAAQDGDNVFVRDGVYVTGGRAVAGTMTNRVAIDRAITLLSVNGPQVTSIEGAADVRCAYVGTNVVLSGFTLTNGHTLTSGDRNTERSGGGVWCEESGVVSNCVLAGNSAWNDGGGAAHGSLFNCLLTNNSSSSAYSGGGGAFLSILHNCILTGNSAENGGGAHVSTLYNCTLTANFLSPKPWQYQSAGAGAYGGTLSNCTLIGNYGTIGTASGGGTCDSTLYNCTLINNVVGGGYSGGGGAAGGTLYNCTLIANYGSKGGGTGGSLLYNCTLINNAAGLDQAGGGAHNSLLYGCTLIGNHCVDFGGGVCGGTLYNCTLLSNFTYSGAGGAYGATLYNCTLTGNSTPGRGGGAYGGSLYNSILYYNTGGTDPNYSGSTLHYSCTTPLPPEGIGNITNEPAFVNLAGGDLHIQFRSPCIDSGTNLSAIITNDLEGNLRPRDGDGDGVAEFDMGAYEFVSHFRRYVWRESPSPDPPFTNWANAAHRIQEALDAAEEGDCVLVTNGVYDAGGRAVSGELTNRAAITKPLTVRSVSGPEVTVIRGAGPMGDTAVRCVYMSNKALLIGFTLSNGCTRLLPGAGPNGVTEQRGGGLLCETNARIMDCVITGNCASESGGGVFGGVLTNCTISNNFAQMRGGGTSVSELLNCLLAGNRANDSGGGAFGGILSECTLTENSAGSGGGARGSTLKRCTLTGNCASVLGGGAIGTLYNCTLRGNVATNYAGGASGTLSNCIITHNSAKSGGGAMGTLYNCVLTCNSANVSGGGSVSSALYNCTIVSNSASVGGGVSGSTLQNSVVYQNSAPNDPNYHNSFFDYSCTTPLPSNGFGNITNDPGFLNGAAGDFHLGYGSPCIDAGTNLGVIITNDLEDHLRPLDGNGDGIGAFDMGAYEFDLRTVVPTNWFVRYGLDPTDPDVVSGNPDNDTHTTFQEWQADTDPTSARSYFHIDHIKCASNAPPVTVYFQSSSNRHYTLFCSTDLIAGNGARTAWTSVTGQTGVQGTGGMDALTDTNAGPRKFYKVGVDAQPYYLRNMVWIPPGTFTMGSRPTEPARYAWEGPQTTVTISRGFCLGRYEVTQAEYLDVMGVNPSYFTGDLKRPVETVSWYDAVGYCDALTARERAAGRLPEGYVYRLPTEAQWEYACRAGTTTPFHYGNELRSGMANFWGYYEYPPCGDSDWYCENPSGIYLGQTTTVGSYAPNQWGLYDMHGNVWEWCQDWWADSLPGGSVTDPTGLETGPHRVFRGGGWYGFAYFCRSAFRNWGDPGYGGRDGGFRVALVAVP